MQPGILGIGVPLGQWTDGVTETLVAMDTGAVLLQEVMGVFDSPGMRRLMGRRHTDQFLFHHNKMTETFALFHVEHSGGNTVCQKAEHQKCVTAEEDVLLEPSAGGRAAACDRRSVV